MEILILQHFTYINVYAYVSEPETKFMSWMSTALITIICVLFSIFGIAFMKRQCTIRCRKPIRHRIDLCIEGQLWSFHVEATTHIMVL